MAGFLAEERSYFAELEKISAIKSTLQKNDLIPGVIINELLGPFYWLLDSQLQLLIDLESMNTRRPPEQQWGQPFLSWEDAAAAWYPEIIRQEKRKKEVLKTWIAKSETFHLNVTDQLKECIAFLPLPHIRLQQYLQFLDVRVLSIPLIKELDC